MAWEWSHTQEAYDNVKDNLSELSKTDLIVIYAEIKSSTMMEHFTYDLNDIKFRFYVQHITRQVDNHKLALDSIVEFIYEFASDYRTCDNGGFNAYVCPYGCHIVSFDKKEND